MAMHILAWSQSINSASLTNENTVTEQIVQTTGSTKFVAPALTKLGAFYAGGSTLTKAEIDAPSLRQVIINDIEPLDVSANPTTPSTLVEFVDKSEEASPLGVGAGPVFQAGEQLGMKVATSGAAQARVVIMVYDQLVDVPKPTDADVGGPRGTAGSIERIRLTGSTTLTAEAWTTVALTPDQGLKSGWYAVGGGLGRSAGMVAWRVIPQYGSWRPGALGVTAVSGIPHKAVRNFRWGTWFVFQNTSVPSVEVLASSADTSEIFVWDAMYLGESTPNELIQKLAGPTNIIGPSGSTA